MIESHLPTAGPVVPRGTYQRRSPGKNPAPKPATPEAPVSPKSAAPKEAVVAERSGQTSSGFSKVDGGRVEGRKLTTPRFPAVYLTNRGCISKQTAEAAQGAAAAAAIGAAAAKRAATEVCPKEQQQGTKQ